MPPKKKKLIIVNRNFIEAYNLNFNRACLQKKSCDNSMPKSVKSPVKCVVRTVASDIFVTNEFCNPIANSKIQTIKLA